MAAFFVDVEENCLPDTFILLAYKLVKINLAILLRDSELLKIRNLLSKEDEKYYNDCGKTFYVTTMQRFTVGDRWNSLQKL